MLWCHPPGSLHHQQLPTIFLRKTSLENISSQHTFKKLQEEMLLMEKKQSCCSGYLFVFIYKSHIKPRKPIRHFYIFYQINSLTGFQKNHQTVGVFKKK